MDTSNLIEHYLSYPTYINKLNREFSKHFYENIFYTNIDALLEDCDLIKFSNSHWNYRPDVFCEDVYNEYRFWPVIIFSNNLRSYFEFNQHNIKDGIIIAPKKNVIMKILKM